ncbi:MAG: MotA/TolQ/ExbB proton channel family protein [Rhodospirillaceae bacterium]|nr:MotA/TolQ/ExbB proton channel family protein [Rhodospirillaceae bacterium]
MPPATTVADVTLAAVHDYSLPGLFLQADPIVKGVMILLILASVVSWGIIIDKTVRFRRLAKDAGRLEGLARARATVLPRASDGLIAQIVAAGAHEAQERLDGESRGESRERCQRAMRSAMADGLRASEPGLPFLATVGSTAPFVGLFGTVWGIMNSFTSIAQSNDTSLAVVAPGIAEALFATAIGLVAAIPAVIAYNKLTTNLGRTSQRMAFAIDDLATQMTRRTGRGLTAEAAE